LILDHDVAGVEGDVTSGTLRERHVDRAIDLFGCRDGPLSGGMAMGATGFFATSFELAAAKASGLAALGPLQFVDFLS
jgi:hypothetical protein